MILSIDLETYSPVPIEYGVYRYSEEAEVLLMAFALDDQPIEIVDIAQHEPIPGYIMSHLTNPDTIKTAFNAQFERVILKYALGIDIPAEQWDCTQVRSIMLGLPFSLAQVAEVLRLPIEKDRAGQNLIRYFSIPDKNGKQHTAADAPEKWEQFKEYCKKDVEVEQAVRRAVLPFAVSDVERQTWTLDQKINDAGIAVDQFLVNRAISADGHMREKLQAEAISLTGLENPNSLTQLKDWLEEELGEQVVSLTKKSLPALLDGLVNGTATRVLEIRQEMSRTSVAKYKALQRSVCRDGRIRGTLQYYGASRTGRWGGRLFQPQNLPQIKLADIDLARTLLKNGDTETIELVYGSLSQVLSELIRTALVPSEGNNFIIADFSQIEARIIAWLAGEKWRTDLFERGDDIYVASASRMFRMKPENVTKDIRKKGKVSELACGYGGGVGALERMGALDMGLTKEELPELIQAWREANPCIVQLWRDMERAAIKAVRDGSRVTASCITFHVAGGILRMRLPSGRSLSYVRPHLVEGKYGSDSLAFEGTEQGTKKWGVVPTYGGRLVENAVQAIARDCLVETLLAVQREGLNTVFHVHDELIVEGRGCLDKVLEIMSRAIPWAPGLILKAEGEELPYYKK